MEYKGYMVTKEEKLKLNNDRTTKTYEKYYYGNWKKYVDSCIERDIYKDITEISFNKRVYDRFIGDSNLKEYIELELGFTTEIKVNLLPLDYGYNVSIILK